jgi:exodeoxyribonuclease-5
MEFAYAITCHASQGSSWEKVIFMYEDFMRDKEDKKKLLYTGITRAEKQITIVI